MKNCVFAISLLFLGFISCTENNNEEIKNVLKVELAELSDAEYPDNPDITVRHDKYTKTVMKEIEFIRRGELFDVYVIPETSKDDTAHLFDIDLMEFIPTIPEYVRGDDYLSLISVVNQEWNRNQVKWQDDQLITANHSEHCVVNGETVTRIDLARNCLNAYLWEVFLYSEVDGKNKVFYHGWFNFPKELYHELYEKRNGSEFKDVAFYLEHWHNPPSKKIDLSVLRSINESKRTTVSNQSEVMYPLEGERKKKQICIITPEVVERMSDFHTDASTFATFSPPGFYNRADPRTTELGRFQQLDSVYHSMAETQLGNRDEFAFYYSDDKGRKTQLIIGGLDLSELPKLSPEDCNKGYQYPMGVGNHPFYEDYVIHEGKSSLTNPFFGILLDHNGKWLDSHMIGIDGPLLHIDNEDPTKLHVWIMSFERHALVAHYVVDLSMGK